MNFLRIFRTVAPALCLSCSLFAQRDDYQNRCQQETANRLRVDRQDVFTNVQSSNNGRAQIGWKVRGREGYCVIDNRMNVVEFNDNGGGNNGGGSGGRNGGGRPIDMPRMQGDTSGRGNFNGDRNIRITRGWLDTRSQPYVALSGDNNFKITFWGDVTQANGPREYTMRITRSDRGNATGTATFRMNGDRNEVEYIQVSGRMNNRDFSGIFNRD